MSVSSWIAGPKNQTRAAKAATAKGENNGRIHEAHVSRRVRHGHLIEIGGVQDHLHILANFTPAKAVSDMIRDIKANASRWVNQLPEVTSRFEWQKGYAAFTVSYSQVPSVRAYARNQEEHHRVTTFGEEYIAFLRRHDIDVDRRWLFEDEHHG